MRSLKEVTRYEDLAFYEWKALATKCGGLDNVLAIIRGEKAVKIEGLIKLFDQNGRRIPKGLQNNVCDANKNFYLVQLEFASMEDYAGRLLKFQEAFHPGPLSVAEFQKKIAELLEELRGDVLLKDLLNGVHLPIIIPGFKLLDVNSKKFDYGKVLDEKLLTALKIAYEKQFPGRTFYNLRKDELEGQVSIIPSTRHENLIEKMKQDIVYAIYFPNPLQGFSSLASREQMKDLPESLILTGGFDTSVAITMYPDILARDWHTPGYDLSALAWQSSGCSLAFGAGDDKLRFYHGARLGNADDVCSSGLLFLGSAS